MRDFANLLKADVALEERMLKMIQRELRTLPGGRLKLGAPGHRGLLQTGECRS